jgi:hypothetical protein
VRAERHGTFETPLRIEGLPEKLLRQAMLVKVLFGQRPDNDAPTHA